MVFGSVCRDELSRVEVLQWRLRRRRRRFEPPRWCLWEFLVVIVVAVFQDILEGRQA